ncbi:hypothetical protein JCM3770_002925 [Rhodotorula araucariae]
MPRRALHFVLAILLLAVLARAAPPVGASTDTDAHDSVLPVPVADDAARPAPHAAVARAHRPLVLAARQPSQPEPPSQPLPFRILRGPRRRRAAATADPEAGAGAGASIHREPFASRAAAASAAAAGGGGGGVPSPTGTPAQGQGQTQTLSRASGGVVSTGLLTPSSSPSPSAEPADAALTAGEDGDDVTVTQTQYETASGVLVTSTASGFVPSANSNRDSATVPLGGTGANGLVGTDPAASSQTRPATGTVTAGAGAAAGGAAGWAGAATVVAVAAGMVLC